MGTDFWGLRPPKIGIYYIITNIVASKKARYLWENKFDIIIALKVYYKLWTWCMKWERFSHKYVFTVCPWMKLTKLEKSLILNLRRKVILKKILHVQKIRLSSRNCRSKIILSVHKWWNHDNISYNKWTNCC